MINFTHLAAFYAVVETGSVTAASEHLHVSQPALTREIRELEGRLGVPLFDRLPRGMQPTEAGRLLADYASQIFGLARAAENALEEFAGLTRGHLGLAASRTIGVYLLPAVLDEFRKRYPGVTVEVVVSNSERIEQELLAHEHQIGLIEGPFDGETFDAVVLGRDDLIAVASPVHRLARKRVLHAADLDDAELVTREPGSGTRAVVEEAYLRHGIRLSGMMSVGSTEAIKRLLRLGTAVAWMSRHTVTEELDAKLLVQLPIRDLAIARDLTMIWRKSRSLSPSARAFRALTAEMFGRTER
ncbi:LysR family transcriptional regulator [Burkholderia ambifaria]|uniref:LysR family transcriptional regulator n=1 Tax=Burkholderia ambifaria TaxID=152480 RepID=UPI001FC8ACC7|nr:LysR family transcriptional regulator [Burkholderia ambifaria]